jgi:hypothetical protein
MEHSLHLGAGHFIKGVSPTSSRKILKKVQHGGDNGDEDGDNIGDEEDSVEFEVADSIGKALALRNQVSIHIFGKAVQLIASCLDRFASHRKLEPFLKSHAKKWTFHVFNFGIG